MFIYNLFGPDMTYQGDREFKTTYLLTYLHTYVCIHFVYYLEDIKILRIIFIFAQMQLICMQGNFTFDTNK